MKNDDEQSSLILAVIGIIPVIWFALLVAPYLSSGLMGILDGVPEAMNHPFSIRLCGDSVKTVLIFLLSYGMGIGIYISTRKHYRRGEEHGSAKWGNVKKINRRYKEKRFTKNKLLTMHVQISYNMRKHLRNVLTVVIGGSGSGKTRFFAKPNLMQANTSFVVLDPKGENLRDTGYLLEEKGYEVRVLDLINMEKSHCYNPFVYLKDDNDVQRLVTNLFKATTPKGSQSNDPFWDTAASMLLLALIFYLRYEAPEEEQNFPMVMEMLRAGEVREDDDQYQSPLDELFERLEMKNPEHIAVKYYKDYHSGSAKTLKSIQITLAARLEKFNLSSLAGDIAKMEDRNVKRGDIYHADLDPIFGSEQGGYRPVLVIQNNIGNKYSPTVIVAAITSKEKMKLPTHIAVPEMEELEKDSVVLLEQLRTLDKRRLENYVCTLDRTEMEKINKAIRRSTGIPKIIEKPLVVSLCRVCAGNFYDVPGHYIRRVNPEQRYKDTCMFCNVRNGYDYYIGRKNK